MKKLLTLAALFLCIKLSATTYTFNFSDGKETTWSNMSNWQSGSYPSAPAESDSIVLSPPDSTAGWICHLDVNFNVSGVTIFVSKKTLLIIDPGKQLGLSHTGVTYSTTPSRLRLDDSASCNVSGTIHNTASTISSAGNFFIEPGGSVWLIRIELGFENFVGAQLFCNSFLQNKGAIHGSASAYMQVASMRNESEISFGNGIHPNDICTLGFGTLDNTGSITGNSTLNISTHLNNRGTISLGAGLDMPVASLSGSIENYNSLSLTGISNFSGNITNSGSINTEGNSASFSGTLVNPGGIYLLTLVNVQLSGSLDNAGSIFLDNRGSDHVILSMNLVNTGTFKTQGFSGIKFEGGSVINNNIIEMYHYGIIQLKTVFINTGTLTTYGEVHAGGTFINSGVWNVNLP